MQILKPLLLLVLSFALFSLTPLLADTTDIEIEVQSHLKFPDTETADSAQDIVVQATDGGAAVFSATGRRNRFVYVRVMSRRVRLVSESGKRLIVDNFTYGGSLLPFFRGAIGRFDTHGNLNNIRIGATANVRSKQKTGTYSGNITLKITYYGSHH